MRSKEDEVRKDAAIALGEIGDIKAVEALLKTLGDKNYLVRQYSAKALGQIKNEKAVDSLRI